MKLMDLMDLVDLALNVCQLADRCSTGPWTVEKPDANDSRPRRMKISAPEPWRRRPPVTKGIGWEEHRDVAEICGGQSEQANANAEFIALAREALPLLAGSFIVLARMYVGKEKMQRDEGVYLEDVKEGIHEGDVYRATVGSNRFLEEIADAIDRLFVASGGWIGGFPLTDRNASPDARLISGGNGARSTRAELLRRIAAVIDPAGDIQRLEDKPASERVPVNGRPHIPDFWTALPSELRAGLMGETLTDEEVTQELRRLSQRFIERRKATA